SCTTTARATNLPAGYAGATTRSWSGTTAPPCTRPSSTTRARIASLCVPPSPGPVRHSDYPTPPRHFHRHHDQESHHTKSTPPHQSGDNNNETATHHGRSSFGPV